MVQRRMNPVLMLPESSFSRMNVKGYRVKPVTDLGDIFLLLLIVLGCGACNAAELVLQWRFDGDLLDSSGLGNDAESAGGPSRFVNGQFGQAIGLRSGESIVCKSVTNLPTVPGESWTINVWARLDGALKDGAIVGGFGGRAEVFADKRFIICFNESVYFWEGNSRERRRDLDSEVPFPADGKWHMYTISFDSSEQRMVLSVDAEAIVIVQPVTTLSAALPEASVGGAPDFFGSSFEGDIDEFSIWNGSLTEAEIELLHRTNSIVSPPPVWTRMWFVAIVCLLLGSGVTVVWRWHERRKQQRRIADLERASVLERERARIAQDIHDELGAGLTRVALLGEMTLEELTDSGEAHSLVSEIAHTARELVDTLDEIVWAVDPKNDTLEGLSSYLLRYAEDFLKSAHTRLRFRVPPALPDVELAAAVRHHLLLAFKEGLNNLVKHSEATECLISIEQKGDQAAFSIEDNGRGIQHVERNGPGGNGLGIMEKRMEAINGTLKVESLKPGGVRVTFSLPLPRYHRDKEAN